MRVSDLTRQKLVNATLDLGDGDVVALTFDRNRITPAWIAEAAERDKEQDALSLSKALADVILSWDVYQETEGDFPPSAENIAVLSFATQSELLKQMIEQSAPSRAEGNASSVPSSTPPSTFTVPEPTSPNGQATSPSPALSASPSPT